MYSNYMGKKRTTKSGHKDLILEGEKKAVEKYIVQCIYSHFSGCFLFICLYFLPNLFHVNNYTFVSSCSAYTAWLRCNAILYMFKHTSISFRYEKKVVQKRKLNAIIIISQKTTENFQIKLAQGWKCFFLSFLRLIEFFLKENFFSFVKVNENDVNA